VRPDYYGNPAGLTEDVDVVRAVYAAFAARDIEGMLAHLAPDCVLIVEATARMAGRTAPYRGHAGIREYFADADRVWERLTLHADDFRVLPGSVIVMGHAAGRRDGRPVRRTAMWTWRLRDGLVSSVRVSDLGDAPAPE
jgi:ketosteroid isomerase-like protein